MAYARLEGEGKDGKDGNDGREIYSGGSSTTTTVFACGNQDVVHEKEEEEAATAAVCRGGTRADPTLTVCSGVAFGVGRAGYQKDFSTVPREGERGERGEPSPQKKRRCKQK